MLNEKQPYQGLSEREYEEQFRQREMKSLQRRAAKWGCRWSQRRRREPFLESGVGRLPG